MLDQQKEIFREEAAELLSDLEDSLLELEESPEDMDLVAKVFRSMHTIKGSGAMFGFDDIAAFTHEVETVYDLVRNGEVPVTKELVSKSLAARDHISSLLSGEDIDEARGEELVTAFQQMVPGQQPAAPVETAPEDLGYGLFDDAPVEPPAPVAEAPSANADATYRISLKLDRHIINTGTRPDGLLRELAELGPHQMVAHTGDIPSLDQLAPEECYLHWDIILTTDQGLNAIKDVFIFVEDDIELKIDVIDDGEDPDADVDYMRIGEILLARGDITQQELDEILGQNKPIGQKLIDSNVVPQEKIESALKEQEMVRAARTQRKAQETATSVRVPAERLDYLVDMVGELVTVQARLSQAAGMREDSELVAIAEEVERLTAELRDNSLSMRMLPIGTTFSKFKRLVRDLSNELGKDIELKTSGAETELDKTVIEKLNDPMVHLIRNSLDHGIEAPDVRAAAGKQATGTVLLTAAHSGDSVEITIQDDGKGLDRDAIFEKGVEKGLISADAKLSDTEIYNLIFAPGFSTAKVVSNVSGRGVGMDVVKRSIDSLRGSISIDSQQGVGSTISIRIPLTLAIVESLLVSVDNESYALPLSIVEECVELTRQDIANAHGRHLVNVRDQIVPYIPLRQEFEAISEPPDVEQVVITNLNGNRVGFVVDQVVGQHQSVIKTLGRMCKDVKGLSGATILGDGTVALILDVNHLAKKVEQEAA
ncbi:CheA signal transduction histidine kinase [Malonomonas rubra DSM 5091]|uniref:Chemotaxis protein CheA n=1 Tax=Malonomonas rubra DSM 5091 TaxID=1122189 RepID=A0A1M6IRH5_MALRU|nr:chemotaxis protein CheA [Malonomonas rubra]SHJ36929.1 CheA signal transduction histidine kinase [Malonomonas rubra DSM 5091]